MSTDMCVHSRERVIKDVDIGLGVECTSERDTLLLTTAQVDALFTDFCLVPGRQHVDVGLQSAA